MNPDQVLNQLLSSAANQNAAPDPSEGDQTMRDQQLQRANIEAFRNQMQPLGATFNGQMALQKLLGDSTADKVQRAAAAEVLHPTMRASIGSNGEMAFSQAPGVQNAVPVRNNQIGATGVAQQTDAVSNFDQAFNKIKGLTDEAEIATAYSSLVNSSTQFIQGREQQIRDEVGKANNMPKLKSTLEADRALDEAFWRSRGLSYQGPTDESLANMRMFEQVQTDTDQEVARRMKLDPAIAGMQAKMGILDTVVGKQLRDKTNDPDKMAAANLIPASSIDATLVTLGKDPKTVTPQERQQVALGITNGNRVYSTAQQIGLSSPAQVALLAVDESDATVSDMAKRKMASMFDDPRSMQAVLTGYKNFDKDVLANLGKEDKKAFEVPRDATGAEKTRAQEAIKIAKMQYVIQNLQQKRDVAFTTNLDQWAPPQDPSLNEFSGIVDTLKVQPKAFSLDDVVSRMDWSGQDRATKIQALTNYVQSQASGLQDSKFFGAPMNYSNPELAQKYIQTLVVKSISGLTQTLQRAGGLTGDYNTLTGNIPVEQQGQTPFAIRGL